LDQPYALACVNVIAAETDAQAEYLATSFYQLALGLFRNDRRPLPPPVDNMDLIWTEAEKAGVNQMMKYSFKGSIATVESGLQDFANQTGVNEIMIASHMYDLENRKKSMELISRIFKTT